MPQMNKYTVNWNKAFYENVSYSVKWTPITRFAREIDQLEQLAAEYREDALDLSDLSEAKELIEWVKRK